MESCSFAGLHPAAIALYFILLLCTGAFTMHPCFIALSLTGAACFALRIGGRGLVRKAPLLLIPALIAAGVNVLFNHRGVTVLGHFPTGNPLTLEALIYGAAAGLSVCAVIIWCWCFYKVFSADKLMSLTGRLLPSLTAVITLTLRFIPLFVRRFREINSARHQFGRGASDGNLLQRLRNLAAIFSILLTRSLEDSVHTADSMKSRGFGLPHRTSYDRFRFRRRDAVMILLMLCFGAAALWGLISGQAEFRYYPRLYHSDPCFGAVVETAGFGLLCFLPLFYEIKEALKWRLQASRL
ncbi:MAG: energy-coupling factor transporter transmembrane protein EcfT [Ruminococcus sp.]|nr:energy-coupling factor transporter transmembrane protein EcfT [Ruminococcus sp.]